MSAQTTNLFVLDDLEDAAMTNTLAERDLSALRAVAHWIRTFVAKPHEDLGRAGTVCPFVPEALEAKTLWLAPEQVADRSVEDVVELVNGYQRLFLDSEPRDGNGLDHKATVVVFTDLSTDRAPAFFDEVLQDLRAPSYVEDGFVMGEFYESNQGTAIYNSSFRPFTPPVPFALIRHAVVGDWKFFLDNEEWFDHWADRYGVSGAYALAEELRRMPWRASGA
jgi:Domain of unknown function (DUF6875)